MIICSAHYLTNSNNNTIYTVIKGFEIIGERKNT